MKLRFLSFVAIATMSLSAMAQTWTAPVMPESPAQGVEYTADGATPYYLYNVGCAQFVTGANTWATEISLGKNSTPYMELVVEALEEGEADVYPDCVKLKLNGTFKFTGDHDRVDYPVTDTYLWRNSETNGFIDRNGQACWFWKFTKAESGNYYWQSAPGMGDFSDAETQYAKGEGAGSAVTFNASEDAENIEWAFVPTSSITAEDMAAYGEKVNLYNARVALYEVLNDAVTYNVDYAAASAVYNNANATTEEVAAATETLRPVVNKAAVLATIPNSSEENPLDITKYVLVNADFSAAADNGTNPPGWTVTPGMGNNLGQQGASYTNNDVDPAVTISKFIEAWLPANNETKQGLKDGVICQQVSGLPEGRYRIAADVMAVWQGDELDEDPRGIYLYYNNGSFTMHGDALSTENGKPEHFTFDFDYDGAETMTIGLMAENANINWMGMDNFQLFAIGTVKNLPSFTALAGACATAKEINYNEYKAEAAIISDFESALNNAQSLVNAGSDDSKDQEYKDAFQELDAARAALTESQAAYKKLAAFVEQLNSDQEKYTGDLQTFVEELYEDYSDAYEQGSMTTAEIEAAIEGYAQQIKEKTQELFDAAVAQDTSLEQPLDITPLFDHMSFAYGTSQTAFGNGYPSADEPIWQPVDTQGNPTSQGNFKTNYSTAEVWNNSPFDIRRTIENLPKGNYTLKAHAFFRAADNDTNYPTWTEDNTYGEGFAYIYAGVNRTPITNVAAIASDLLADIPNPYDCNNGNYLPNNQQSAYKIFTEGQYAELAEKCYIGVSGNVYEDGGSLNVGFAGTEDLAANHWTIVYNFELYYNGVANLDDDINALIERLTETEDLGVSANIAIRNQAIEKGNAALGADFDTQSAAIKELQDAIAELSKTQELVNQLQDSYTFYERCEINLLVMPEDPTYEELKNTIDEAFTGESFESNQQIQGWIDQLPVAWVKYVTSCTEMAEASVDMPTDITPIILNADFEYNGERGVTPSYWTRNGSIGANQGFQSNTYVNEETGVTVANFLEAWKSGNAALDDGSFSQTIAAPLPAGFYRLSVDGFATNQGNEEVPEGVFLFARGGGASNITSIGQATATPETFVVDFEANGTGLTTVGIYTEGTAANWFAVDNFRLEYLGTTAPDAIENINASTTAPVAIFGIDGRQQSSLRRGINIVRQNGKVQKVLVK